MEEILNSLWWIGGAVIVASFAFLWVNTGEPVAEPADVPNRVEPD